MTFCAACGARQPVGAKFCGECGTPVSAPATQVQPVQPTESSTVGPAAPSAPTTPQTAWAAASSAPREGATASNAPMPHAPGVPTGSSATPPAPAPTGYPSSDPGWVPEGSPDLVAARASAGALAANARSRFAISQDVAKSSVADGLVALGAQVVIVSTLVAVIAACTGHLGTPLDWVRVGVAVTGLAVHGQFGASAVTGNGGELGTGAAGTASIALTFQLLSLMATTMLMSFVLGKRRERLKGTDTLPQLVSAAATGAAAYAAGLCLLGLLIRGTAAFGLDEQSRSYLSNQGLPTDVTFGPVVVPTLIGSFLVTFIAALAGRFVARARLRAPGTTTIDAAGASLPPWAAQWVRPVAAALSTLTTAVVVGGVALLGYIAFQFVHGLLTTATGPVQGAGHYVADSSANTGASIVGGFIVFVLALPNLVIYALGTSMGASLEVAVAASTAGVTTTGGGGYSYQHGVGLLSGGLPGAAWLLVLIPLVASLVVGMRTALRQDPRIQSWDAWWRHGAAYALLWLLLAFAAQLRGDASAQITSSSTGGKETATAYATAGVNVWAALAVGFVWGVTTFAAGRLVTRGVTSALPRTATALAGRAIHPLWAVQIADLTRRIGRTVPQRLAARAALAPAYTSEGGEGAGPLVRLIDHRRRGRLVGLVAGAAVVVGLGWTVVDDVVSNKVYGPAQAVTAFYDAVRAGDADGALSQLDVPNAADRSLLTAAALREQNKAGGPGQISIDAVDVNGDVATVDLTVKAADGTTSTTTVSLARDLTSSHWGVFHGWRMTSDLPSLTVSATGAVSKVTADGVSLTAGTTYPTFPGVIDVAAVGPSNQFTTGTQNVPAFAWGSQQQANLSVALGGSGQQAVIDAVVQRLRECTKSTSPSPSNCPLQDNGAPYGASGTWKLDGTPSVTVDTDSSGNITLNGTVSSTYTYTTTDPFFGPSSSQTDPLTNSFTGSVQVDGNSLSVTSLTAGY